ncbi:hypothetical protein FOL47_001670 [Perkinsus chesapeaki]|uniref:Homoserine dehydrogenase n=1 Tax=Perkinsus chesapeaki TaxID=330153 RepID=A0A7J6MIB9_PERCH|nr:hypothetical protein FOL47_001670 [Perkinsus chesapeaki]
MAQPSICDRVTVDVALFMHLVDSYALSGDSMKRMRLCSLMQFMIAGFRPRENEINDDCQVLRCIPFGSFTYNLHLPWASDLDFVLLPASAQYADLLSPGATAMSARTESAPESDGNRGIDNVKKAELCAALLGEISDYLARTLPSGLETSAYIALMSQHFECLRPLVLMVKHVLLCDGLVSTYNGGVSSYTLVLMTVSFLNQFYSNDCWIGVPLGQLLLGFLGWYGGDNDNDKDEVGVVGCCCSGGGDEDTLLYNGDRVSLVFPDGSTFTSFDASRLIIRPLSSSSSGDSVNFELRSENDPSINLFKMDMLVILDPLSPLGETLNLGRSAWRWPSVTAALRSARKSLLSGNWWGQKYGMSIPTVWVAAKRAGHGSVSEPLVGADSNGSATGTTRSSELEGGNGMHAGGNRSDDDTTMKSVQSVTEVCVRDPSKKRDIQFPEGCEILPDPEAILNDETIDIIVEVMGGTDEAWACTQKALKSGKHVVSANKALISKYTDEIERLALEQNVQFLYEAAVCGGIPIIKTVLRGLRADTFNHISGIMNGSTNYILSRMENEGVSYEEVINDARRLGYLEADPSADLEGYDARSKICILARIGFGVTVADENKLYTAGITNITSRDFEFAKSLGYTIKLIAKARLLPRDNATTENRLECWVSPAFVPLTNAMAKVSGPTNCVEVSTVQVGPQWYIGAGAGRYPTANSIVSDVLEAVDNCSAGIGFSSPYGSRRIDGKVEADINARVYIRVADKQSAVATLTKEGVQIDPDTPADVVISTKSVSLLQAKAALDASAVVMPILE